MQLVREVRLEKCYVVLVDNDKNDGEPQDIYMMANLEEHLNIKCEFF